jgi:hypothetical protein
MAVFGVWYGMVRLPLKNGLNPNPSFVKVSEMVPWVVPYILVWYRWLYHTTTIPYGMVWDSGMESHTIPEKKSGLRRILFPPLLRTACRWFCC